MVLVPLHYPQNTPRPLKNSKKAVCEYDRVNLSIDNCQVKLAYGAKADRIIRPPRKRGGRRRRCMMQCRFEERHRVPLNIVWVAARGRAPRGKAFSGELPRSPCKQGAKDEGRDATRGRGDGGGDPRPRRLGADASCGTPGVRAPAGRGTTPPASCESPVGCSSRLQGGGGWQALQKEPREPRRRLAGRAGSGPAPMWLLGSQRGPCHAASSAPTVFSNSQTAAGSHTPCWAGGS